MEILHAIFLLISYLLLFLFLILFFFIIKIFTGKSIYNPDYAPVKGTIFNQLLYYNYIYDYQLQVTKNHPTYRLLGLTRSDIFTSDTRNIEHMLKTSFKKYAKGKYREETVADLWGEGIFAVDGDKWRHQRKLVVSEFSTRVVTEFSCSVFRKHAVTLVRAVSKLAASGQAIPLQDMVMKYTFHSIFEVGFGIDLNWLGKSEEGTTFIKAFDDANELVFTRFFYPFWKMQRFLNIGSEAVFKKNVKVVDDFIYNIISTKKELLALKRDCNVKKQDILSRLLMESEKNPTMTDKYLRDIILNILVAGKDSTALAMSWFFYMLCKYPLIQEKVAKEVIDITNSEGNNTVDHVDEFMTTLTTATFDQMHYLHAAMSETLRLFPPIPMDARRAEEDDILPDGHKVKKGDEISYVTYAMARLPYIWGEDADSFRPERWLKDGVFQPESPFKFVTFHAGPQICLGKDFTYRQMKIYSIALIRFFRFKLADDMDNITYKTAFSLQMNKDLYVCAVPRIT